MQNTFKVTEPVKFMVSTTLKNTFKTIVDKIKSTPKHERYKIDTQLVNLKERKR
jgi:hypothetical protein